MQFVAAWRVFVKEKANKQVLLLTRYNSRTEQCPSDSDNEDGEGRRAMPCPDWDAQILDGYDQFPELQAHLEARGQNDKLPPGIEELVLRVYRPSPKNTKHVPDFEVVSSFGSLVAARAQGKESVLERLGPKVPMTAAKKPSARSTLPRPCPTPSPPTRIGAQRPDMDLQQAMVFDRDLCLGW